MLCFNGVILLLLPQPPGSAPPPPPPSRVSSRHSGKYGTASYGTLPSKFSHSSSTTTYAASTLRAKSMDLSYKDDDGSGAYSRSQSLECSACVLEAQAECRECEESLYQRADNCRECVEYGLTRGEGEYKEHKVSCFTACAPKTKTNTKKSSHHGKSSRKESKRKEAAKLRAPSLEEETEA